MKRALLSCMCVTAMALACGGAEHRPPTGEATVVAIAIPDGWTSRDTVAIEPSETVDVADLEASLFVGLLRSDGVVLPFAAYGNGSWIRLDHDSIPKSIVQYDGHWYHAVSEDSFQPLTAGSIVRFVFGDAMYEPWGQITDFHPRVIPYYKPVDRVGVVLSEERPLELMRRVEPDSVPAQLISLIREEFERRERSAAAREAPGYKEGILAFGHPVDAAVRAKEPLRFPIFYHGKFGQDGATLYYFLAKRAYPVVPNEKPHYSAYEPFTVFQGWVLSRDGAYDLSQPHMILTCCSGMNVGGVEPFAILALDGRNFVIAEISGWEYREKTILEIGSSGLETVLEDLYSEAEPTTEESSVVEVVGQGVISTERNETFPAEDPVDGSLWFSVYDDSFGAQTIMFARRTERRWAAPEVAPFSGEWGDLAPGFSPDGATLYFTSNRPRALDESPADMNIWQVHRAGDSWGEPELMGSPLNSDAEDIHTSATNQAIWLASNRAGGRGRSDIYRVGENGTAEHLAAPINDENSQPDVWVSPDESWMILVITDRPGGYGGDDLYLSRFDGESWSVPTNLGSEINSAEYEYGPTVSADGGYLYFTSHRSGSADVYRVPLSSVVNGSR